MRRHSINQTFGFVDFQALLSLSKSSKTIKQSKNKSKIGRQTKISNSYNQSLSKKKINYQSYSKTQILDKNTFKFNSTNNFQLKNGLASGTVHQFHSRKLFNFQSQAEMLFTSIYQFLQYKNTFLTKHQKIRINKWLKAMQQNMYNEVWIQNRNLYLKALLIMLENQTLQKPFLTLPNQGPLPKLNYSDLSIRIREKLVQKEDSKSRANSKSLSRSLSKSINKNYIWSKRDSLKQGMVNTNNLSNKEDDTYNLVRNNLHLYQSQKNSKTQKQNNSYFFNTCQFNLPSKLQKQRNSVNKGNYERGFLSTVQAKKINHIFSEQNSQSHQQYIFKKQHHQMHKHFQQLKGISVNIEKSHNKNKKTIKNKDLHQQYTMMTEFQNNENLEYLANLHVYNQNKNQKINLHLQEQKLFKQSKKQTQKKVFLDGVQIIKSIQQYLQPLSKQFLKNHQYFMILSKISSKLQSYKDKFSRSGNIKRQIDTNRKTSLNFNYQMNHNQFKSTKKINLRDTISITGQQTREFLNFLGKFNQN